MYNCCDECHNMGSSVYLCQNCVNARISELEATIEEWGRTAPDGWQARQEQEAKILLENEELKDKVAELADTHRKHKAFTKTLDVIIEICESFGMTGDDDPLQRIWNIAKGQGAVSSKKRR